MNQTPLLDCLIIGGGAAGMVASTYMKRFRRSVAIADSGKSRLLWIPTSHNYPGYAKGIHGRDLLAGLRRQAEEYDVPIVDAMVTGISRLEDGTFEATAGDRTLHARTVILATGVVDITPDFPGAGEALANGCLRYCPICDGFEAIDKKVAVISKGNAGIGEALFIRNYTDDLTLLTLGEPTHPTQDQQGKMDEAGLKRIDTLVVGMRYRDDQSVEVRFDDGVTESFDVIYSALGTRVNTELAQSLQAKCAPEGQVLVDDHMQSSIQGLYAAGDIVTGVNQIAVAMGHAAIAATAIHNQLGRPLHRGRGEKGAKGEMSEMR